MGKNKAEKKARDMARRAALTPEERAREDKSARKTKLIALMILVFFTVIGLLLPDSNSGSNDASSDSTSPVCSKANSEDLKNLKDGLKNKALSLSNGFVGEFEANDIEDIKAIFPTYIKPRVVAAQINVPGDGIVIGLWGIQDFDYGWKILGLNEEARTYSVYGADTEDDSASGRVRSKMLELSPNTSALNCATASATP